MIFPKYRTLTNVPKVVLYTITLMFMLCFTTGIAQTRATISGNISDQFGSLPGATVSIEGSEVLQPQM